MSAGFNCGAVGGEGFDELAGAVFADFLKQQQRLAGQLFEDFIEYTVGNR